MNSEDSSSNPITLDSVEKFSLNIKVKQEKITPPSSPTKNPDAALILSSIDSILDTALSAIKNEKDDEKKSIEPIKSSNEILAELFQVFNSAPPTESLNKDQANESTSSKKKKKHKKHKKKHKKKGRSSSDDDDNGSDDAEENIIKKSHKHKRVKKEKKSKRKRDESQSKDEKNVEKRKIKKEKHDEIVVKKESERRSSKRKKTNKDKDLNDLEMDMDEYEHKLLEDAKKTSSSSSVKMSSTVSSVGHRSNKIVIKDLKNSAIYEETMSQVKANEREKEKRNAAQEDGELSSADERSSGISLSDEETYLRNKHSRTINRDRDRDHSPSQYYGTSSRSSDTRNSYRERDRYYDTEQRSSYGNDRRDTGRRSSYIRRRTRSRSRSRRRDNSEDRIDKKRLLEIARKNAILMLKNGTLPGTSGMAPDAKEKVLAKMRYGGNNHKY